MHDQTQGPVGLLQRLVDQDRGTDRVKLLNARILCRRITLNAPLGGLVLTGGDIAVSCCSLLSASGISVLREVAPGIPVGVLKGGQCSGLKVVTKAGAFGAEDALCRAVDSLRMF